MKLGQLLMLIVFAVLSAAFTMTKFAHYDLTRAQAEYQMLQRAEHIRGVLMATRRVYQHQFLESGIEITPKTIGFLPAHAMSEISADFSNWEDSGVMFDNVSEEPRNLLHQADEVEFRAIKFFRENPDEQVRFEPFLDEEGDEFYHYARPIWVESSCLACHGAKADAPASIRSQYDNAYNLEVGDLRGILSIKIPARQVFSELQRSFLTQLGLGIGMLFIIAISLGWAIRHFVSQPLKTLDSSVRKIAAGDLDFQIQPLRGEFRQIADSFNQMTRSLRSTQSEVENSEQRFRKLIEAAQDAILVTDGSGRIIVWNPACERVFGYSASEMCGETVDRLVPDSLRQSHHDRLLQISNEVESRYDGRVTELTAVHRERGLIPIEISINSWVHEASCYHVAIVRDISERKAAIDRLRESEQLRNAVLESMPLPVFYKDAKGLYQGVNKAFEGYFGLERSKLVGRTVFDLHPPELAQTYKQKDDELLSQVGTQVYESKVRKPDGELRDVVFSKATLTDASGEITGLVGAIYDVTERKLADEAIYRLANFDPLTQLPNRRSIEEHLRFAMKAGADGNRYGAVMLLDIDRFKNTNDTQGHGAGDRLLRIVARRIQRSVREDDLVGRFGGDEFVVLIESLSADEGEAVAEAERIAETIRSTVAEPTQLEGNEVPQQITVSIGIALFQGQERAAEELIKRADAAMYTAKERGRNLARFFNPAMQELMEHRVELEKRLREALKHDELVLHYQPQVDASGHWHGLEALVRWQDPERGMIWPAEFIPLAEDTGLVTQIGRQVIDGVCRQLSLWTDAPIAKHWTVAVNVSASEFHEPDFVEFILATIEKHDVDPARLKLEVTESVVLHDLDSVTARMNELIGHGVLFALDDFGTGYSSLGYLKSLPVHELKIDQSFVHNMESRTADAAVVSAVVGIAQSLDLELIAEGVETESQLEFLKQRDCDRFQGYLFSRPLPVDELLAAAGVPSNGRPGPD